MFNNQNDFKDFWEFLIEKADRSDAWWLKTWLEQQIEEFINSDICPKCQSKQKSRLEHWSRTGNYVIEIRTVCTKCNYIFSRFDLRNEIRILLEAGDIKQKDVGILLQELCLQ